jgi:hypothetical protein
MSSRDVTTIEKQSPYQPLAARHHKLVIDVRRAVARNLQAARLEPPDVAIPTSILSAINPPPDQNRANLGIADENNSPTAQK